MTRFVFYDLDNLRAWKLRSGAHHQIVGLLLRAQEAGDRSACATVTNRRTLPPAAAEGWNMLRGLPVFETLVPDEARCEPGPFRAAIARMISACPADVAFVLAPSDWVDETELWLVEALAAAGGTLVVLVCDANFPTAETCGEKFARYASAIASAHLLAPSAFIARRVEAAWGRGVRISANLFAPAEPVARKGPADRLTLVNPHPAKGSAIVEALARRRPDWQFLAVEGWPGSAAMLLDAPNIEHVPFQADLSRVWRATRILLVPSLCEEAFGRVVIEAQSQGIAVVAHDIGGLAEAVGEGGLLFRPPGGSPQMQAIALEAAVERAEMLGVGVLGARALAHAAAYRAEAEASAAAELARLRGRARAIHDRPSRRPRQGTLIFSPHPDDAAFSLGGALAGRHLPQPVTILTIFGRSHYAGGRFHPDSEIGRISALRRAEDEAWAKAHRVALVFLDLPEAGLRDGAAFETVFAPLSPTRSLSAAALADMEEVVERLSPDLVLAPLALGGHRDHVLARRAARLLVEDARLGFYEDLPYAQDAAAEEQAVARGEALSRPAPVMVWFEADEAARKMAGAAFYESQIDPDLTRAIAAYTGALGGERLWVEVGGWPFADAARP